jgi:outer membrane protein assembly factor BamE (lipoprotein component of BamABCDE complex)
MAQVQRIFSFNTSKSNFSRLAIILGVAASLGGCLGYDGVLTRGAVIDKNRVAEVKPGMEAPEVIKLLGTPSTTSTVGGDAWYYFSQRVDRSLAYMPGSVTDQHVQAVYFDKSRKVQRLADYGLEDGKPVNFLSRTTPVPAAEYHMLQGLTSKLGF